MSVLFLFFGRLGFHFSGPFHEGVSNQTQLICIGFLRQFEVCVLQLIPWSCLVFRRSISRLHTIRRSTTKSWHPWNKPIWYINQLKVQGFHSYKQLIIVVKISLPVADGVLYHSSVNWTKLCATDPYAKKGKKIMIVLQYVFQTRTTTTTTTKLLYCSLPIDPKIRKSQKKVFFFSFFFSFKVCIFGSKFAKYLSCLWFRQDT